MINRYILNGRWLIDYLSDTPYTSETEPVISETSDSAVNVPVPGYWEDMSDLFRSTALHTKLKWNPLYTLQRYPQAGFVPDMYLANPVGAFVYQKTFSIDNAPDCAAELFIGGAQNAVSAWLNGAYLGRHEGYSAPFAFSVPNGVLKKGRNTVTLAVSNNRLPGYMNRPVSGLTSRAANECTGGVYGDVEIRLYPDGLKDAFVSVSKDLSFFTVHIEGAENAEKEIRILDGEKLVFSKRLTANENALSIPADGFERWSPDSPKTYTALVCTENQSLCVTFGVRRLTARGTRLYLNGAPYFFRGTCEHCYQSVTVHPTRDRKYYRAVIRKLKKLGFNSIRFHTWVPPEEYLEAADELGMVMEVESPNNTTLAEWKEILRMCRRHPSVNMYSTGNEMQIDADYENHLQKCAALVHENTDSLFSPMSALRGVEYHFVDDEHIEEPFRHNPRRLNALNAFSDVYNSYSLGLTSYESSLGTHDVIDQRNSVYNKPLLSHEICIHGTYIDLSLEERYKGTRIGDTEFMSSVRRHLEDKGLIDRAYLYYKNSCAWQKILRKHCFETVRRSDTFAGYDFLGDIDTHWHTFGYCVGMMNEFYELKYGETEENVRRYNSDTVLLSDLPSCVNFESGAAAEIPVLVSHYGKALPKALLTVTVRNETQVFSRKEMRLSDIECGKITELYRLKMRMPVCKKPMKLTLSVSLSGADTDAQNEWDMYVFPKASASLPKERTLKKHNLAVFSDASANDLASALGNGKRVVLFSAKPFASKEVSWQLSVAGRTHGHLATAIADHPVTKDFPNDGFCSNAFSGMMNCSSAVLDLPSLPHRPIIDVASSYKNAIKEALMFEFGVDNGKLIVCTLNLSENDPGARWLKERILTYAMSDEFIPEQNITLKELSDLMTEEVTLASVNENAAFNKNDITA